MDTLKAFLAVYETTEREVTIGDRPYRFRVPLDIDRFIDDGDPMQDFPLWARIWKASLALANHLATMPKEEAGSILEIGAGRGYLADGIIDFIKRKLGWKGMWRYMIVEKNPYTVRDQKNCYAPIRIGSYGNHPLRKSSAVTGASSQTRCWMRFRFMWS